MKFRKTRYPDHIYEEYRDGEVIQIRIDGKWEDGEVICDGRYVQLFDCPSVGGMYQIGDKPTKRSKKAIEHAQKYCLETIQMNMDLVNHKREYDNIKELEEKLKNFKGMEKQL